MANDCSREAVLAEARELRAWLVAEERVNDGDRGDRRSLTDIMAELEPNLSSFGITRVGDLTGLDVIGIPVFFACRPNSWSLSVSQGKSVHGDQARFGAIMESMEQSLAERSVDLIAYRASKGDMVRRGLRCLGEIGLLRSAPRGIDPSRKYCWMPGVSLKDGGDVYAPYELVGLDLRTNSEWDHATFRMSSVGLAAGPSLCEAVLHATLELIEHDATTLVDLFGMAAGASRPLAHRFGLHDELDHAVLQVEKAGLTCSFAEVPGRVGMPTIAAFINPEPRMTHQSITRTFGGFACRLTPEDAALAALLEAAQSRVTQIAGARDDIFARDYDQKDWHLKSLPKAEVFLDGLAKHSIGKSASPLKKLRHALDKASQVGIKDAYVFPLGCAAAGIRGVRILMPEMQTAAGQGVVQINAHMLASLLRNMNIKEQV